MTDEDALLAAILAAPDEDTPRLAYADLMDETGQHARAEFIRVQVEMARTPHPIVCEKCGNKLVRQRMTSYPDLTRCSTCSYSHGPFWEDTRKRVLEYESLERRELKIYNDRVRSFVEMPMKEMGHDLRELHPEDAGRRVVWDRGFVSGLVLTAADWLSHGDQIRARHPVTRVRLTTLPIIQVNNFGPLPNGANCRYRIATGRPHDDESFWRYSASVSDLTPGSPSYAKSVRLSLADVWPGITFTLPS